METDWVAWNDVDEIMICEGTEEECKAAALSHDYTLAMPKEVWLNDSSWRLE